MLIFLQDAAVHLDVVDVNTVVGLLNSIVGIVGGALGNLKMVEGGGPLTLGGQPLSIVDFGDIVGGLLSVGFIFLFPFFPKLKKKINFLNI